MNKLSLLAAFIRLLLTDTRFFLKALYHYTVEAQGRKVVQQKHGFSQGLPFVELLEVVPEIKETLHHYTFLDGVSRITDMALLKSLCKYYENCNYLEIGSLRGESLINIADAAAQVVSVSLSSEELTQMGYGTFAPMANLFTRNVPNIRHVPHNSMTLDFSTLNQKFDVIFVDGDHSYAGVKSDTQNAFKMLRDENAVIVWHDAGNSYETMRYEVLAGILDGCPADAKGYIYRVTNTLCAIYTRKPLRTFPPASPQRPTKVFDIEVKATPFTS